MALSLERQNVYRERYRGMCSGWRPSGEVYESVARQYAGEGADERYALDLGCGAGGVMELLSPHVQLSVGLDPDLPSLYGHRNPAIHLAAGRAEQIPFGDGMFDLVTCSWVFEHLADPAQTFAQVARVLKPGGHLVFLTPNARSPIAQINRLVPRLMQHGLVRLIYGRQEADTFPTTYAANTVDTIDTLADAVGLRRVRVELISDPTYLAFGEILFRASVLYERLISPERFVHIVGDYVKGRPLA